MKLEDKNPQPLDLLAFELKKAKELEASAREKRVQIEEQILAAVGVKEEGSQTSTGNFFKVTTTGKLTRKLDEKVWRSIAGQFNGEAPIRTKLDVDTRKLKKLAVDNPELFQVALTAITTKPAKSAVKVDEVGE